MNRTINAGKTNRVELSKRQMAELRGGGRPPQGRPTEEGGDPRLAFMVWIAAAGFGKLVYDFISDMGDCD